ncbi:hypothetical protein D9611_010357 [Ephemerocybe angulata]|uniref:PIPK domain-containing protein n=1 Tax=Ephemerocybe angulata TaxID=980116 RepID=A0A8H5BBF6_9AGAR|nr:hypothetical protein D9611_010357 [Tulosesus angulatus]
MANHKPLPAIPTHHDSEMSPTTALLSTDFRSHRSRLLHAAFSEIEVAGGREGWIAAFEDVLDQLSACLSQGNWLRSAKRRRDAKRAMKEQEERRDDGQDVQAKLSENAPIAFPKDPETLEHIRRLASAPSPASSDSDIAHLLLCVTPHGNGNGPLPAEDSGFDIVPANIGCSFATGKYILDNEGGNILFGARGAEGAGRLIGGTFTFKGVSSKEQHQTLSRMLRFAIYTQLSMILEQHFLKDSHIELKIPRPRPMKPSFSTPNRQPVMQGQPPAQKEKPSLFSGVLGMFSKKRDSRTQRRTHDLARVNTIDLGALSESFSPLAASLGDRLRRMSIVGERHTPPPQPKPVDESEPPIEAAVKRIEANSLCLSTSAGVSLSPPPLMKYLAKKEEENPKRRLKGDEKVGMRALLGWEGRDARGKGMIGMAGFVRQQEISVLVSSHVPSTPPSSEPSGDSATPPPSTSHLPLPTLRLCGKPYWKTYCYFSSDDDKCLGEALIGLIDDCNLPCEQSSCQFPRGQHQLRLIHDGVRINVHIDQAEGEEVSPGIQCWESCAVCDAHTSRIELSDGSWLLSFAKFLELLIYSPILADISPPICDHTSKGKVSTEARFNIRRHFSTQAGSVVFSAVPVDDVFELRAPRIQIRSEPEDLSRSATESSEHSQYGHAGDDVDEKNALRDEIRRWWEDVLAHFRKLEVVLGGDETSSIISSPEKELPRLPSSEEPYESLDAAASAFSHSTDISAAPSDQVTARSTTNDGPQSEEYNPSGSASIPEDAVLGSAEVSQTPAPSLPPKDSDKAATRGGVASREDSLKRLVALRDCLQDRVNDLLALLDKTDISTLNDVRRSFLGLAQGTRKRIAAWQKKHLRPKQLILAGELDVREPEWWSKGCHPVPGSNIIVREHDWGSIIAFTLSSKDYRDELVNLAFRRTTAQATPVETPSLAGPQSSFFSVASGYRFFSSQTDLPDPDSNDAAWNSVEPFSAVASRKEHIRDPSSLLSIRDVLRKGSVPATESIGTSGHQTPTSGAVSTTRAKPDIGISMQKADGEVGVEESTESVEKLLHDLHSPVDAEAPPPQSALSDKESTSGQVYGHIRRPAPSSVLSLTADSTTTIGKSGGTVVASPSGSVIGPDNNPPVPPKDPPKVPPKNEDVHEPAGSETMASTASTFATNIASSLMRLVRTPEPPSAPPPPPPRRHGLLNTDIDAIDERPHIKYDWTIGKRVKFSCTVFYAKQFDLLRRRCAIDDIFVKSLSKSTNWAAEGGKSKSNFWKTSDDRFIIKTLVNAWNVADLQFLIDLAPGYFRYMESTANKATVLAKLLGFYTIEVRNLETGAVQSKVNLLVMENLFYDQNISKTFDLKGIQGRKVKPSNTTGGTTKTFFDGEWIEGQQKTLMLVRPYSKRIIQEAIRNDAEFLAKSNIMDYSLLLGVDETKKEIACGLVDTIGSYTFAKTIEYKAKQGLQSGNKEVTVMPPADYQERFVRALEGYFVACPDKWSKPLDESKIISDPDLLPCPL